MINLKKAVTVLERNNDGSISSIMLIKKEGAEDYADYWKEEQIIDNIKLDIKQLLKG